MARTKKPDVRDELIAELTAKLARQELSTSALLSHITNQSTTEGSGPKTRNVAPGQLFVGVRNVSNYTISIESKITGEPTLNLNAPRDGMPDPNTVGIVSYAWWQHMRRGREYGRGQIVRDDSILGGNYEAAPEDNPRDCHPDHAVNLVLDPVAWVAARDDDEISRDVERMTAEPPLRKLEALHFKERERLMDKHVDLAWPDRKRKVERELSSKYKHLKAVVLDRLKDLEPKKE